jgi:threonine-phosphate decarboxylase
MAHSIKKKLSYRHGGRADIDFERLNVPAGPVLDFSINLNSFGPPIAVRESWGEVLSAIETYPTVEGDGVSQYYQQKFGIHPVNILAANGSTEMIYLVPRTFRFGHVLVTTPSYHDYERASILAGAKVKRYPLLTEEEFAPAPLSKMIQRFKTCEAIWLGRPNNPTGSLFPKEIVLELAAEFPDKWFIIDEAFIQFVDHWEDKCLLLEKPKANILVIHSLTKFYALAGLRIGGIIGTEEAISRLRGAKEPWTVNSAAEQTVLLLTECDDYEKQTRSLVRAEYVRVYQKISKLEGIHPFPSSANFMLCQWRKTGNLDDLLQHLLQNGVYVRDCRNFAGLDDNYFRIGLRRPDENDRLVELLSAFPSASSP